MGRFPSTLTLVDDHPEGLSWRISPGHRREYREWGGEGDGWGGAGRDGDLYDCNNRSGLGMAPDTKRRPGDHQGS